MPPLFFKFKNFIQYLPFSLIQCCEIHSMQCKLYHHTAPLSKIIKSISTKKSIITTSIFSGQTWAIPHYFLGQNSLVSCYSKQMSGGNWIVNSHILCQHVKYTCELGYIKIQIKMHTMWRKEQLWLQKKTILKCITL